LPLEIRRNVADEGGVAMTEYEAMNKMYEIVGKSAEINSELSHRIMQLEAEKEVDRLVTNSWKREVMFVTSELARFRNSHHELLQACIALQSEAAARGCGLRIADEAIEKARLI
jgi:hypothetical protein